MRSRQYLSFFLIIFMALSFTPSFQARASGTAQTNPAARARALLSKMTAEQRVGQLFLVSFNGTNTDDKSSIYDLIVNHYIGGVVLLGSNGNFAPAPDTVSTTYQLIANLQTVEHESSQGQLTGVANKTADNSNYIPLFIGISQDGDGYPNDQILSGLTTLPNPMAIGATWDTILSQQVGAAAGRELASLGFNLYFGPPLDVLDSPEETAGNGLAADVFGGDPYWVGEMGQAYIAGLHTGSSGKLLVIAKHFPGRGSSDRPEGEEPATVRKSLESLKQIELAPFFLVTGNSTNSQGVADGLLVSHIRYQGFQGNIRSTTRPVSFDSIALSQILSLSPFATWRQNGGLLVSDDLGSQTVRLFYNPGGQSFQAQLVARDALLAGNDLLYLGNIQSSDAPDNYTTVLNILAFFVQKYREDPAFAQRVDDAVLRILLAKDHLYPNFDYPSVIPSSDGLNTIGQATDITFKVASQGATLISPAPGDLATILPSPPGPRDRIVFLTDTRPGRQCTTCPDAPRLSVDAMENAVLRTYGPRTGGQVTSGHLVSYTFDDMGAIIEGGAGNPDEETNLRLAQWIVINMLDAEPNQPQAIILSRFLSERQDLLRDKRVIVFSFNAPYYLDATDISKLTAYYCLYSKSAAFMDVAVRLLFQEKAPLGYSPVSVAGVGYDLFTATSPDPNQLIELSLDLLPVNTTPVVATPEATATPAYRVGDTISVRTGIILDHNHHPVPDGTGVRFYISSSGEGGAIQQQLDSSTYQGVARTSFSIARAGLLSVRVVSDPATTSVELQLNVSNEGFSVSVVTPTSLVESTSAPEISPTPNPNELSPIKQGYPGISSWLVMLLFLFGIVTLIYWVGTRSISVRWGVRWAICALLGGLLAYNYLALQLPGAAALVRSGGLLGILGLVIFGAALGFGAAYAWMRIVSVKAKRSD